VRTPKVKGATSPKHPKQDLQGPCSHCCKTSSPQWRRGPAAHPVLCNACGLRYGRTGSLDTTPARPTSQGVRKTKTKAQALGTARQPSLEEDLLDSEEEEVLGALVTSATSPTAATAPISPDSMVSEQVSLPAGAATGGQVGQRGKLQPWQALSKACTHPHVQHSTAQYSTAQHSTGRLMCPGRRPY